jgi:hypothetical protein
MKLIRWVGGGLAIVAMAATAAMLSNVAATTNKMYDSETQVTLAQESVCPAALISAYELKLITMECNDLVIAKGASDVVTSGTWRGVSVIPDSKEGCAADRTVRWAMQHVMVAQTHQYSAAESVVGSHTPRVAHTSAPVDFSTV